MKIEILYQDENIIAFNKPSGLLSIPDRYDPEKPCMKYLAEAQVKMKLFVVHRIDKDTSGLIVFAKHEEAHRYMSQLFEGRDVKKFYKALVLGNPHLEEGIIDKPLAAHPVKKGLMVVFTKGKPSRTDFWLEQKWHGYALMKLQIHTGRTHQIRVHMKDLGYPVLCDPLYGNNSEVKLSDFKKKYKLSIEEFEERPILNRLALHAYELDFVDAAGNAINIVAPLSKDMEATIKQLNKWAKN